MPQNPFPTLLCLLCHVSFLSTVFLCVLCDFDGFQPNTVYLRRPLIIEQSPNFRANLPQQSCALQQLFSRNNTQQLQQGLSNTGARIQTTKARALPQRFERTPISFILFHTQTDRRKRRGSQRALRQPSHTFACAPEHYKVHTWYITKWRLHPIY